MGEFEEIDGSITAPIGFLASGVFTGVKKSRNDLALIYSEKEANAAGAFTTNKVKAAPVLLDIDKVKKGRAQAIVINSGNANACTGKRGYDDACTMAKKTADILNIREDAVLVCSTGVIGMYLPMDKIVPGILNAAKSLKKEYSKDIVHAIMTTDKYEKEVAVKLQICGKTVTIGGMAKGSGMICPNVATMLSFITTDANITEGALNKALKGSVKTSYNMISVDGDMSTNDTVLILANGEAQNDLIDIDTPYYNKFYSALEYVNKSLAKMMAKDGEGATKFMEVNVINALTENDAILSAKSIVNSNLVKTAIFGEDANWGRIIASVGYSGANFSPDKIDIYLESSKGKLKVAENGGYIYFDEDFAKEILKERDITIIVDMKAGKQKATAWGCDLSYDYVRINGSYRS